MQRTYSLRYMASPIFMKRYFTIFCLLLVTEIGIAYFHIHDFVRGFLGDVLVIPLCYTLVRSFTKISIKRTVIYVILFAFTVEFAQFFKILAFFHIENRFVQIILGSTFDPADLLAYLVGIIPILLIEKYRSYGKD